MKASWIAAEQERFLLPSAQLQLVNNTLPALYLNNQRNVFLLKSFGWGYSSSTAQSEFTIWFGCNGTTRGDCFPHRIKSLQIGTQVYLASSFISGVINTHLRWVFTGSEQSTGNCLYFSTEPFCVPTKFTLRGFEAVYPYTEWEYSGAISDILFRELP
jgi:hypothetical protein